MKNKLWEACEKNDIDTIRQLIGIPEWRKDCDGFEYEFNDIRCRGGIAYKHKDGFRWSDGTFFTKRECSIYGVPVGKMNTGYDINDVMRQARFLLFIAQEAEGVSSELVQRIGTVIDKCREIIKGGKKMSKFKLYGPPDGDIVVDKYTSAESFRDFLLDDIREIGMEDDIASGIAGAFILKGEHDSVSFIADTGHIKTWLERYAEGKS